MVGTVIKYSLETNHRIACHNALLHALTKSLFNCREIVLRNGTADNLRFKYEIVALCRLKTNPNVTELAVTARLLLMATLNLNGLANSFSVSHTRRSKLNVDTELALELRNDNVKVLLAETGENLLLCLVIHLKLDCRILFEKSVYTGNDLFLVALLAGLDSH